MRLLSRPARPVLFAPLALLACKPKAPEPPPVDTTIPAAQGQLADAVMAEPGGPPSVVVYGHVRVPSFSRMLPVFAEQLMPPSQRMAANEMTLRMGLQMALGGNRDAVVEHVDLARPMGCVVVSPKRYDKPLACVVGYDGGFARLVEDLGPQGYVSGGDDFAEYRFEGQPFYFTAMGQHVAFSFAPDLVAATRDRLQRDIIDAPPGAEDVALTAYPAVIFEDAEREIMGFIEQLAQVPDGADPMKAKQLEAQRTQWLSYGELEQVELWVDLDEDAGRTRLGYRGTAKPGTSTEQAYAKQRGQSLDLDLVSGLPAEAIMAAGMHFDSDAIRDDPMMGAYVQAWSTPGDDGAGAAMAELFRESLTLWSSLSTGHSAVAFIHVPRTKGGW